MTEMYLKGIRKLSGSITNPQNAPRVAEVRLQRQYGMQTSKQEQAQEAYNKAKLKNVTTD